LVDGLATSEAERAQLCGLKKNALIYPEGGKRIPLAASLVQIRRSTLI